jgi:DNA polymerase III alpha subunit (gram-positive type)
LTDRKVCYKIIDKEVLAMRQVLAVARDEDFAVLFEYDTEQGKAFRIILDVKKGKKEEYDFDEPLENEINLIEKYEANGWIVVWAYGLGEVKLMQKEYT